MIKTKLNRKKETGGIEASLRDRMPYYIMLAPFMIFFVALLMLISLILQLVLVIL